MGAKEGTPLGTWSRLLVHPYLVRGLFYGALALYFLLFSAVTVLKHEALETTAFDLGNMDQAVWNSLHGNLLPFTNWGEGGSRLAYHVDPILVLISPLYLIYSDPRTLLVFQSLVVALGALPIFWLAKEKVGENLFTLAFPLAYLLFPALEAANLFDFHPTTLAAALLAYAFYFLEKRRYLCFLLFAILTMACKEEMALLIVMMGLYTLFRGWRGGWRVGLGTVALGLAWFFAAVYIIIPHYNPTGESPYLKAYGYLGEGPLGILRSLLTRPDLVISNLWVKEKLIYLRDLLTPLAFLSLLAPQILLLSLPTLAINLLSTKPEFYTLEKFHYAAPLVPFVVLSALWGSDFLAGWLASRWRLDRRRSLFFLSALILLFSLFYHHSRGFTPLARGFGWPRVTEHDRLAQKFMGLIPAEATVSAQSKLNPHLSQRPKIYMFPKVEDAEFVFFDVTVDSWPIHPNDQKRLFDSLLSEGFGILAAQEGYILLQRGANARALPQEFYDFARVKNRQIQYPVSVDFGGLLRFLGFDLREEGGMTSLVLYWQPLVPLEEDYRIYPFFYDQEGRIIEDTTLRPMVVTIWYPTSLWREGEVVQMETLPWKVEEDYDIGLGVIKGGDWEEVGERLPVEVHPSPLVVATFDGGTAVRLMEVRDGLPRPIWRSFEAPQASHELKAKIGGGALLLGYDLAPSSLSQGGILQLTLYWQALGEMEKDYTVFTHLLDGEGRIRGQKDSFPLGGLRPTTGWMEGEYIIDEYDLSVQPDALPGEYLLEVGIYDVSTGERLPVYDEGGQPTGDRLLLPTVIEVVTP